MAHDCINFDIWQLTLSTAKLWLLRYTLNSNFQLPAENLCLHALLEQPYSHVPSPVNDINVPFFFSPHQLPAPSNWPFKTDPKHYHHSATDCNLSLTCSTWAFLNYYSSIWNELPGQLVHWGRNPTANLSSTPKQLLSPPSDTQTVPCFKPQFTTFLTVCLILGICMHGLSMFELLESKDHTFFVVVFLLFLF